MLAIVGLGNPGERYARTRHNIGFLAVEQLACPGGTPWGLEVECQARVRTAMLGERRVLLVQPQTYMNRSGAAVRALAARFGCPPGDLLVVLDDFLLDFGRLRFRRGGSDGGHNGLASILEALGTQAVPRLRVGIGQPSPQTSAIDYVLSPFGPDEPVSALAAEAAQAAAFCVEAGIEAAMNRYNGT
ncbi:MAG: aminoacyl-tRNA hydrolase [Candidatus Latescibacterota bacterium]